MARARLPALGSLPPVRSSDFMPEASRGGQPRQRQLLVTLASHFSQRPGFAHVQRRLNFDLLALNLSITLSGSLYKRVLWLFCKVSHAQMSYMCGDTTVRFCNADEFSVYLPNAGCQIDKSLERSY